MGLPSSYIIFATLHRTAFTHAPRPSARCAAGELGVRTAHQAEEKAQMVAAVRRLQPASAEDGADSGDDAAELDAAAHGTASNLAAEMKVHAFVMCSRLLPVPRSSCLHRLQCALRSRQFAG